jgi:cyanophycin synthetase
MAADRIVVELDERAAVERALAMARPGDLVVIFADDVTRTWKQVIYWGKPRGPSDDEAGHDALGRPFALEALREAEIR